MFISKRLFYPTPPERKDLDMSNDSEYIYLNFPAFEKEILKCNKPVIVEFGAEWCGNCQIMKPILSDLSTIYRDQIKIVTLDIEQNKHLVKRYRIQAKPTFLFLKSGQVVDIIICLTPRREFEEKIFKLLT